MGIPYRARVNERVFLNLPGFHGGAYVLSYVEDTSARGRVECDDPACTRCRANSLHKVGTLIAALRLFRSGLVDEFEPYDRRQRELEAPRE